MIQKKHRNPGRPPLPKGQVKGKIIPVRATNGEAVSWVKAAKANKQSLSDWIRSTLNARIDRGRIQIKTLPARAGSIPPLAAGPVTLEYHV